jgi:hypothetical protein
MIKKYGLVEYDKNKNKNKNENPHIIHVLHSSKQIAATISQKKYHDTNPFPSKVCCPTHKLSDTKGSGHSRHDVPIIY